MNATAGKGSLLKQADHIQPHFVELKNYSGNKVIMLRACAEAAEASSEASRPLDIRKSWSGKAPGSMASFSPIHGAFFTSPVIYRRAIGGDQPTVPAMITAA